MKTSAPKRGPVVPTGPSLFGPPSAGRRAACALLLAAACVLGQGGDPARAAEYRDPEGRFTLALTDGFVEVGRPILEARLAALRQGGAPVPAYQAAFDRGGESRLAYPYALLEVVPVQGAAWTTADLEGLLGRMDTEQAARESAAAFDRLGLGNLLRDPRVAFVRWEPNRQAGAYRIRTQAQGAEVHGQGRIYFYRNGYIALWFYYLAGTPYADVADRFTAGLTVLPEHRVPSPGRALRPGTILIMVGGVVAAGMAVWLVVRKRVGKGGS